MSAPASRPMHRPEKFGRLWWLPSDGDGNGLSDTGWAPIADVDADLVPILLAEFRAAGVPAYAAPVSRRPLPRRRARFPVPRRWHVWVGTSCYGKGEEVLRIRLFALLRQARP
jgi:hypothetical protein